ncbi:MAG TPA: hypothetical protein ENK43_10175 [Planctomycetes bacterium]|nr:hypothetical protein [Planctomycetota bacterium]
MRLLRGLLWLAVPLLLVTGCGGGNGKGRFAYSISLVGLPDSNGRTTHYEGWAVINGTARSTGKFVIDGTGPSATVYNLERTRSFGPASAAVFGPASTFLGEQFPFLVDATHLFITVEPEGDHDREPSCQVILAGPIVNGAAHLSPTGISVESGFPCAQDDGMGGAVLGLADFSTATGFVELRSPTDDVSNPTPNDFAGVWFTQGGAQGLSLPTLPGSFRYEGFAVINGVTRSLGRFRDPGARDEDFATALQRGDDGPGPSFPGQDFVQSFTPTVPFDPPVLDLATEANFPGEGDFRAFISLEPFPDNDVAPFGITLLSAVIPPTAVSAGGSGNVDVDMVAGALPQAAGALTSTSFTLMDLTLPANASTFNDRRGHYELFCTLAGQDQSIDRFVIVGEDLFSLSTGLMFGTRTQAVFDAVSTGNAMFPDLTAATECFITFEEEGDPDPAPSARVMLEGVPSGGMVSLTTAGAVATGGRGLADFSMITGKFQLDSPTNDASGVPADDQFGILYRLVSVGSDRDAASLELPDLPSGFCYEGWVEDRATGVVYSTGKFVDPGASDRNDGISQSRGMEPKKGFPGEDFLNAVPTQSLMAVGPDEITQVFVTVEPEPDGAAGPSLFRILEVTVPPGQAPGGVGGPALPMTNVAPTGATLFADMVILNGD